MSHGWRKFRIRVMEIQKPIGSYENIRSVFLPQCTMFVDGRKDNTPPRSYRIGVELSASHRRTNVERVIFESEHFSVWRDAFGRHIFQWKFRWNTTNVSDNAVLRRRQHIESFCSFFLIFVLLCGWYLFWETMIIIINIKLKKGVAENSTHFSTTRRLCHCEICGPSRRSTLWWLMAARNKNGTHSRMPRAHKCSRDWSVAGDGDGAIGHRSMKNYFVDVVVLAVWRLSKRIMCIWFFESFSNFSLLTIGPLLLLIFAKRAQRRRWNIKIGRDSSSFILFTLFAWISPFDFFLSSLPNHSHI